MTRRDPPAPLSPAEADAVAARARERLLELLVEHEAVTAFRELRGVGADMERLASRALRSIQK